MPIFKAPPFGVFILDLKSEISEYEKVYKTAKGSQKYLYGTLLAENRGYLVALEAGRHFAIRFGKAHSVCVCGITIPSTSRGEDFPRFLETKGHLDANGKPINEFYYLKYLAPQHFNVYLVCQGCHAVEKQEFSFPDGNPKHNCEALIATINYQI
jgi:hypothetical protein